MSTLSPSATSFLASDTKSNNWDYNFGSYTQLTINEEFLSSGDVSVYNTAFSVDESLEIAKGMLPFESDPTAPSDPTIPEPTTATLSLLALAALAARRRRR